MDDLNSSPCSTPVQSITIDEGEGSYCMADCTGYKHEPSLYLRVCCIISNLGQTVTIRGIVGGYSGTAGDSLATHNGRRFSTRDNDNDPWSGVNCAQIDTGAWWYDGCYHSNLNGRYFNTSISNDQGITWWHWKRHYTLKFTEMKTRRNN
uniref:Fibrinogen C-terminal domain-containing protein n=1 Tax=Amphimedon queenslandica TaxID=400682 RepID=A0A1X7U4K0_AMPQE